MFFPFFFVCLFSLFSSVLSPSALFHFFIFVLVSSTLASYRVGKQPGPVAIRRACNQSSSVSFQCTCFGCLPQDFVLR